MTYWTVTGGREGGREKREEREEGERKRVNKVSTYNAYVPGPGSIVLIIN